jgi:hypothetical protein
MQRFITWRNAMPLLTAEAVKKTLHDLYAYEISDADAQDIANGVGAIFTMSHHLKALTVDDVAPPFGFGELAAEATRIGKLMR